MFKKIFSAVLLAAVLIFSANNFANAANDYRDERDFRGKADFYIVVNCNEWVSLRYAPNVNSERLTKIPLGTKVLAADMNPRNGFIAVHYNGFKGYVLEEYLKFYSMS